MDQADTIIEDSQKRLLNELGRENGNVQGHLKQIAQRLQSEPEKVNEREKWYFTAIERAVKASLWMVEDMEGMLDQGFLLDVAENCTTRPGTAPGAEVPPSQGKRKVRRSTSKSMVVQGDGVALVAASGSGDPRPGNLTDVEVIARPNSQGSRVV
jgi:hypothetical protein